MSRVLIVGGAGYQGTELVDYLLRFHPHLKINVLDTFWFWDSVQQYKDEFQHHADLRTQDLPLSIFKGDIRNKKDIVTAMRGCDQVINLACLSNDPSSDLDKEITLEINWWGVLNVIEVAAYFNVERFIQVSSSSVYGVREEEKVTEDLIPQPLTSYSIYKANIDDMLLTSTTDYLNFIILRPATVVGLSGRQRLDLVLNIFCHQAFKNNKITVHGGSQYRPNIAIQDMIYTYEKVLTGDLGQFIGQVFNIGDTNYTLLELANMVKEVMKEGFNKDIEIEITETNDSRSYRLDSSKLRPMISKWVGIKLTVYDLLRAFHNNTVRTDKTKNIEVMKQVLCHN